MLSLCGFGVCSRWVPLEEEEKTNLLTIQMRFYLISMVDPWFPISMNKAKHHSKEKPLDEAKIAKLLDLLDNILAGLTE